MLGPHELEMAMPTQTMPHTAQADLLKASTAATFRSICGVEPRLDDPVDGNIEAHGVEAVIALVGNVSWSLSLAFPSATAEEVARKFSGFEIPFDSADMIDVIGELANVLAGDVAARMDSRGVKVKLSMPSVVRGDALDLTQPSAVESVRLRFLLPQGPMRVVLAMGASAA
jgi:chemotaxis protein CheX